MPSTNFSDGRVCDSTFRFQTASPASKAPGFSPMRGSGVGADIDTLPTGVGELLDWYVEGAQASDATAATARRVEKIELIMDEEGRVEARALIVGSSEREGADCEDTVFSVLRFRRSSPPAFSAYARSRSFDRQRHPTPF